MSLRPIAVLAPVVICLFVATAAGGQTAPSAMDKATAQAAQPRTADAAADRLDVLPLLRRPRGERRHVVIDAIARPASTLGDRLFDELWPSIADKGWRTQSLEAWLFKVPWYRDGKGLMARWREKHPGEALDYDTGGTLNNVLFKYPGWRAREGYSQERLGVPGESDDPLPAGRN